MKVIFAAGGTGGHINPALASAGEVEYAAIRMPTYFL